MLNFPLIQFVTTMQNLVAVSHAGCAHVGDPKLGIADTRSHFDTVLTCDKVTDTQTHRHKCQMYGVLHSFIGKIIGKKMSL